MKELLLSVLLCPMLLFIGWFLWTGYDQSLEDYIERSL